MNTLARFLVITSLTAMLSGCMGGGAPDYGSRAQAMVNVDAKSLPADLMGCDDFYGDDWDTPDRLVGVNGRPEIVVLVQAGEMVCAGYKSQLENRLRDVGLGELKALNGADDSIGMNGTPDPGGESASGYGPLEDSNPLPAAPVGGESASAAGPVDDSNPLPARTDTTKSSADLTDTPGDM